MRFLKVFSLFIRWNIPELNNQTFFVSTFEENGMFMLAVVFLFSHFSPIEIIGFIKYLLYPSEDIDFLGSNLKNYFTSD